MTPVGHCTVGAAIAIATLPRQHSGKRAAVQIGVFAFAAIIPDLQFPGWGHHPHFISHSLLVTLALIGAGCLLLALCQPARQRLGGWLAIGGGSMAWLSHLLLDSFYNHGLGIDILWPVSNFRLVLPIPWLAVFDSTWGPLSPQALRLEGLELATFLPLVALALLGLWVIPHKIISPQEVS